MDNTDHAAQILQYQLQHIDVESRASTNCVLFARWPTLAFRMVAVNANYLASGSLVAHLDIQVELNQQLPATFIATCCTGIGPDLEAALFDGLDAWLQADGSVIFSVLNQRSVMNTAWCPNGDPFGIPGWDCFLSPYIVRGNDTAQQILIDFVQANPLLDPVRQALSPHLDQQRLIQSVSIFRGIASGEQYADCRVNGQSTTALDELLLATAWPVAEVGFGTVRQSLLLLNPQHR